MALIGIATYCTEENQKFSCLKQMLESLFDTVDFRKHRLIIVDNGSCEDVKRLLSTDARDLNRWLSYQKPFYYGAPNSLQVITNSTNEGTAKAINKAWYYRMPGEHCIKMDDDIIVNHTGWVDEMEAAIHRDPKIGQVGLKRKDCWEFPEHQNDDFKSTLKMLPHNPGENWIVVEQVKHVIGSCVMHSAALLDKVGYLYQPSLYGYDDVIMSHRTHLAGFYSCFLPHISIDHIDNGDTPYQDWKHKHSAERTQEVISLVAEMYNGTKSIYYDI